MELQSDAKKSFKLTFFDENVTSTGIHICSVVFHINKSLRTKNACFEVWPVVYNVYSQDYQTYGDFKVSDSLPSF